MSNVFFPSVNLNTARVTYKNLLTFWAKTTANLPFTYYFFGIISQLFYFIINNKTRRIIDFVNSNKELRNKIWMKLATKLDWIEKKGKEKKDGKKRGKIGWWACALA